MHHVSSRPDRPAGVGRDTSCRLDKNVWLRGHESPLTEHVVDHPQADIERLQAELG